MILWKRSKQDREPVSYTHLDVYKRQLLQWYNINKRILPWRDRNNAYYTWVSEIMLQQTRVEAVKPYFQRFITALPDVQALSLIHIWKHERDIDCISYRVKMRDTVTKSQYKGEYYE